MGPTAGQYTHIASRYGGIGSPYSRIVPAFAFRRSRRWPKRFLIYLGADGNLPGYLAVPDAQGPWPNVVVVQDVVGMTGNLRRLSDRFAHNGYLAPAPALYGGRGPKIRCMISTIRAHLAGHGSAHDDLVAARDHLIADERYSGKVGPAGFAWVRWVRLQLAPGACSTAPNYGLLPKDVEALRESCPVVGSFGANAPIVRRGTAVVTFFDGHLK